LLTKKIEHIPKAISICQEKPSAPNMTLHLVSTYTYI
jgi:hypothetical protein